MSQFEHVLPGEEGEKGMVYAFEPEPANYNLLVNNIEINGYKNIIPVQKAVSNTTGKARLFIDARYSVSHRIYQYSGYEDSIEIETITLDDFFKDKGLSVDVVKLDIEGAEMAALLGMDGLIRQNETIKIFTEFYPPGLNAMGYSAEEFAHLLLAEWHFSVTSIGDYIRNKGYVQVYTVGELLDLYKESMFGNLFLEKAITKQRLSENL